MGRRVAIGGARDVTANRGSVGSGENNPFGWSVVSVGFDLVVLKLRTCSTRSGTFRWV